MGIDKGEYKVALSSLTKDVGFTYREKMTICLKLIYYGEIVSVTKIINEKTDPQLCYLISNVRKALNNEEDKTDKDSIMALVQQFADDPVIADDVIEDLVKYTAALKNIGDDKEFWEEKNLESQALFKLKNTMVQEALILFKQNRSSGEYFKNIVKDIVTAEGRAQQVAENLVKIREVLDKISKRKNPLFEAVEKNLTQLERYLDYFPAKRMLEGIFEIARKHNNQMNNPLDNIYLKLIRCATEYLYELVKGTFSHKEVIETFNFLYRMQSNLNLISFTEELKLFMSSQSNFASFLDKSGLLDDLSLMPQRTISMIKPYSESFKGKTYSSNGSLLKMFSLNSERYIAKDIDLFLSHVLVTIQPASTASLS